MTPKTGFTTKGRQYLDDGVPLPSVTTILNAYPKNLTGWAARTTAGYAVDHWDELTEQPVSKRLHTLTGVIWERRDTAALSGRKIHQFGEQVVAGADVHVDPEHMGSVEAYARWLDQWDVQPLAVETPIINRTVGYAGRPDLLATTRDGTRWLFDIKTGGVYDSQVLQLTGYAHGEHYLPDATGQEQPWPTPERCAILQVSPDSVRVLPACVDAFAWRTFMHVAEVWAWWEQAERFRKAGDPWPIGEPLPVPALSDDRVPVLRAVD